jgi:hypothetical protein
MHAGIYVAFSIVKVALLIIGIVIVFRTLKKDKGRALKYLFATVGMVIILSAVEFIILKSV